MPSKRNGVASVPMMIVVGDINTGKTRMLGELVRHAQTNEWYHLYVTSHEEGSRTLYEDMGLREVNTEIVDKWDDAWLKRIQIKKDVLESKAGTRVLLLDDLGFFVGTIKKSLLERPLNRWEERQVGNSSSDKARWIDTTAKQLVEGNRRLDQQGYGKLATSALSWLEQVFGLPWDYIVLTSREKVYTHRMTGEQFIGPDVEGSTRNMLEAATSINAWSFKKQQGDVMLRGLTTIDHVTLQTKNRFGGRVTYVNPVASDLLSMFTNKPRAMKPEEAAIKLSAIINTGRGN